MKKSAAFLFLEIFILMSCFTTASVARISDITSSVEIKVFRVDTDFSHTLFYVVDRTTNICFSTLKKNGLINDDGFAVIPCENLKKIPQIKKFIETGK